MPRNSLLFLIPQISGYKNLWQHIRIRITRIPVRQQIKCCLVAAWLDGFGLVAWLVGFSWERSIFCDHNQKLPSIESYKIDHYNVHSIHSGNHCNKDFYMRVLCVSVCVCVGCLVLQKKS